MRAAVLALLPLTAAFTIASTPGAAVGESCDGRPATIVAAAGRPTTGTEGDDVIVGTDGPDVVDALGGNDVVCGLGGGDTLSGGAGDDRLFGGLSGRDENGTYLADRVVPGAGDDLIDVGLDPEALTTGPEDNGRGFDPISWEGSPSGVTVDLVAGTAVGEGTDTIVLQPAIGIVGSKHADTVTGSDQEDLVETGPGDDVVDTAGGSDVVSGGSGDDDVDTGDGDDYVFVGRGADVVTTGAGDDGATIGRTGAPSRVWTGGGRDSVLTESAGEIRTGSGNDDLQMSVHPDPVEFDVAGGPGRDEISVITRALGDVPVTWDNGRGRVRSGATSLGRTSGYERLTIDDGVRWTFRGSAADEHIRASYRASAVLLLGRGGDDVLVGTSNDDVLDGGPGRDVLRGSIGRDTCRAGEQVRLCELVGP
jgi:Ca2+-binding RTX toxin-like protein